MAEVLVLVDSAEGTVKKATFELLTAAKALGEPSAVVVGASGTAAALKDQLGEYGAAKVYATGDLGGKLPGPAVAAAMKAVIDGGDVPDVILFPQSYEGRDVVARLSVKLDRTVLTNNTDIEVDGDAVKVTTPIFGGNTLVTTAFTGEGPHLAVFRPKSFAAESSSIAKVPRSTKATTAWNRESSLTFACGGKTPVNQTVIRAKIATTTPTARCAGSREAMFPAPAIKARRRTRRGRGRSGPRLALGRGGCGRSGGRAPASRSEANGRARPPPVRPRRSRRR